MIKAQGTSVSKWSRSKAPAGARLIRWLREFSLIIAQVLPGVHDTHCQWVKCTQIRKHESRFYRRPEVPLKYPHSSERASDGEQATGEGGGKGTSRLGGWQLVLLPLSLASHRVGSPLREILRTIRSARGNLREAHEISPLKYGSRHPPRSLLLPVSYSTSLLLPRLLQEEAFSGGGIDSIQGAQTLQDKISFT